MRKVVDTGGATAFIDLTLNMALFFATVFIIALLSMKVETIKAEEGKKPLADFIITVSWPLEYPADVDSYLKDPQGNIVNYKTKEAGLMHLDRDDLGRAGDKIRLPDGREIEYGQNRETVTIRGFVPGEYVFNIHLFSGSDSKLPVPVLVEIEKVNPHIHTIYGGDYVLTYPGEEITVAHFVIDEYGKIVNVTQEPKVSMATSFNDFRGGR